MREQYANWTDYCQTPRVLNEHLGPVFYSAAFIQGFFSNVGDLLNNNFSFSDKTGDLRRSFHWKSLNFDNPFAVNYVGNSTMKDPGRITVKGTTFTTYAKPFREERFPMVFNTLSKELKCQFFIVDLKGCHAVLQAALLKNPILFELFSRADSDIWVEYVKRTENGPDNLKIYKEDKPLLKIGFYASLNGGSIRTEQAILGHLKRSIQQGHPLYERLKTFPTAMLAHPITQELLEVSQFWESLRGEMYVPTREGMVTRKMTADEAIKKAEAAKNKAANVLLENKPFPLYRLPKEGDPKPHQLPSLYYTALEVIFASKVVGHVFNKLHSGTERYINGGTGLVQGIHDGLLFVTDSEADLTDLVDDVNHKLGIYSKDALGIPLRVSLTPCDGYNWVASLSSDSVDKVLDQNSLSSVAEQEEESNAS